MCAPPINVMVMRTTTTTTRDDDDDEENGSSLDVAGARFSVCVSVDEATLCTYCIGAKRKDRGAAGILTPSQQLLFHYSTIPPPPTRLFAHPTTLQAL